jgi:hypothetical protein
VHDPLERNQDALELFGDVRLRLIQKLAPHPTDKEAHSIQDCCRFAATVTYNACAEYFRQKFPRRTGLNNSLRYFLTHVPAYALWDVGDGAMCCGFATWRHLSAHAFDDAYLTRLHRASQTLDAETLPAKAVEWFRREDWDRLIHTIFEHLQTPLLFDDLVSLVADWLGIKEETSVPTFSRPFQNTSELIETRQVLRQLWHVILQLRPLERCAYLLNPSGGELEVFPWHGIASIRDIGSALHLTEAQYECLWLKLSMDDALRLEAGALCTPEEKFALLWNFLPLEDQLIAQLLGATQQQVINLRRLARDRMVRLMRAPMSPPGSQKKFDGR